ncbi:hypothetical protein Trydic_g3253 [Trypoxylus dichotomus]
MPSTDKRPSADKVKEFIGKYINLNTMTQTSLVYDKLIGRKHVHNKYTDEDFDEDLGSVLRRSGCKDEKIAFILEKSNMLDSSFLERMNTLLANEEVPGLFEGGEYTTLMTKCKEGAQREEQVEEMQKSLAVKSQELQVKNETANAKLKQMVKDQQEAEKK